MTVPTQPVTIKLADFGGPAAAGITVTARASDVDHTIAGVFVGTDPVTGITDATGQVVLQLFPNALTPTGLGTAGTQVRVTAMIPNSHPLDVVAAIPNAPANLVDCLVEQDPVTGQVYAADAQNSANTAAADALQTQADRGQTALDRTATAADRVQTGLDRAQTGLDRVATAADRVATAADAAAALVSKNAAASSETNAATYAAAAATGAKFFDTIALGLAGVASTTTFGVKSGGSDGLLRPSLYKNNAGTAQFLYGVVPGSEIDGEIVQETLLSYSFSIRDYLGHAAVALSPDGTLNVDTLQVTYINGTTIAALQAAIAANSVLAHNADPLSTIVGVTPVMTFNDLYGRTAFEVESDGSVAMAALAVPVVNGFDVRATLRPANAGTFDGELIYFNNTGQSLAEGPGGPITLTQDFDNIGFPAAGAVSPSSYSALTVANCSNLGVQEPPLFGALGNIKTLLAAENGLVYTAHKYQLLGADNSHGSYSITALNKGNALYSAAISQAAAAASIAATENRTCIAGAVFWTQGEADAAMSIATYQAALTTLASDYNTDLKAATGQSQTVHFITYQTGSATANRNVAQAQLAASVAVANIHLACAMYVFNYQDSQHVDATGSKWLGGYYGLVYKRVAIDGVTWSPIRPISSVKSGKFANVKFNVMVKPLVLDTTQVPAQPQGGFTLVDAGGSDIPITSVSVSSPDTVKIVANTTIPVGAKLRYGFNPAIGKGAYTGGAGNLRDCQGDVATYLSHRLDNWCVIFEFAL